jgi:Fur family transcriptional regulator, ferric uptake regulator
MPNVGAASRPCIPTDENLILIAMDKRNSKQKAAIRDAFTSADRPLSPQETLQYASKYHASIGIATVYRNIQALVEDGWLVAVELPGRSLRYELAGKEHHHHFRCNSCDKVFDLKGCGLPKARLPRGFTASGHELLLYGNCPSCSPSPRLRG